MVLALYIAVAFGVLAYGFCRVAVVEATACAIGRSDAEDFALRGGERNQHHVILILAHPRLAFGGEHADHFHLTFFTRIVVPTGS